MIRKIIGSLSAVALRIINSFQSKIDAYIAENGTQQSLNTLLEHIFTHLKRS